MRGEKTKYFAPKLALIDGDSSPCDLYKLTLIGTLPLKHSVMGTCTSVQYTAVEESSHQKYND